MLKLSPSLSFTLTLVSELCDRAHVRERMPKQASAKEGCNYDWPQLAASGLTRTDVQISLICASR